LAVTCKKERGGMLDNSVQILFVPEGKYNLNSGLEEE
jgi:hypothetical protein